MNDKNEKIMRRNNEKLGKWNTIPGLPESPDEPNGW
jgi:hypothetical protein